eukprot:4414807-Pleurochrysis_carterae.AAC.1
MLHLLRFTGQLRTSWEALDDWRYQRQKLQAVHMGGAFCGFTNRMGHSDLCQQHWQRAFARARALLATLD